MPFQQLVTVGGPVALLGVAIHLFSQRWLCHPAVERGLHWRGLSLKIACWPVYLAATLLGVVRADVPYVPTAKEARRGRFVRLGWPHLAVAGLWSATMAWTLTTRLVRAPEVTLFLTSEAVWAMVAFSSLALLMTSGGLWAAWRARRLPADAAWDAVDVGALAAPASHLADSGDGAPERRHALT
jgi:cellulose synthase (UDP-forming)